MRLAYALVAALAGCSRAPHATPPRAESTRSVARAPGAPAPGQRAASVPSVASVPSTAPARSGRKPASPIPSATRQLLLSVAGSWDSSTIELSRYERTGPEASWRRLDAWQGVAGRAGLAWGRGLHGNGAPPGESGPVKKEGDGRAVAGVFRLGPAFGYAGHPPAGTELRYTHSTTTWRCVDDPRSHHYGELLDASHVEPDWRSAEHLRLHSDAYRLLVVVQHNTAHQPGAGSCVFLHVWNNPHHGTSGCTAMPYRRVQRLVRWLTPSRAVFVALPESELSALASRWHLPGAGPTFRASRPSRRAASRRDRRGP